MSGLALTTLFLIKQINAKPNNNTKKKIDEVVGGGRLPALHDQIKYN